ALGVEVSTNIANTAVVGIIRGSTPGKTIAIRADMDALTITEQTGKPYASTIPGKMHACGHDGHTAILMGVAKLIIERKDDLIGNVKLFFQPAEEGPGGALPMIEAGVMVNPTVDAVIGLHLNTSNIQMGQIALRSGANSAGTDEIHIRLKGKGGHGAHPHNTIDAIIPTGHLIVALQTIVSREVDPLGSAVITIGTVNGGYRNNIIADNVFLTGTVRTLDPTVRNSMPERIERIIKGISDTFRCTYEFNYIWGYPSVINDVAMTSLAEEVGHCLLGKENVVRAPHPSMGGEDFSYFAEKAPGVFFSLGAKNEAKDCIYPGHNSRYDFDEDAIPVGMAMLTGIALTYLRS
ncbi:MAG: amidohydrolase, partial [bacterium]|nr:amidohydrolase [bacterium]